MNVYLIALLSSLSLLSARRIKHQSKSQSLAGNEDQKYEHAVLEEDRHLAGRNQSLSLNSDDDDKWFWDSKSDNGDNRSTSEALPVPSSIRAMWSWGSDVVETHNSRTSLLNFAKAPFGRTKEKFTYIWLNAYSALHNRNRWHQLRSMNSMLHDANIKVDFLDGNHEWLLDEKREDGLNHCRKFREFQDETASMSERFDGLQMDVEPWALPSWKSTKDSVVLQNKYMDFMRACKAIVNQPLAVAISFWWYKAPCFKDMMQSNNLFSYLAVMNYRRSCDWADSAIATMLDHARGRQKFVFGVETDPDVTETESYGTRGSARGYEAVFRDNNLFMQKYSSQPGFAGVAVHYYKDFKSIPAGRVGRVDRCSSQ